MINNVYEELRNFVKEHHGFSGKDFEEHPEIFQKYNLTMDNIRQFQNKRIKLQFKQVNDLFSQSGEKIGRIKLDGEKIKFYEGKRRSKYFLLDAGLFEGFFATLIPLSIEEI